MRVAILHYHLRGTGVTRVIEHTLTALHGEDVQSVVMVGEAETDSRSGVQVCEHPALRFDHPPENLSPAQAAAELRLHASEALGAEPDLWHVHNHTLSRNTLLPAILQDMASHGARILLHLHDFIEEGRARQFRNLLENLGEGDEDQLSQKLYPSGSGVHFAVVTGRDRDLLVQAGAAFERVHYLPNPVSWGPKPDSEEEPERTRPMVIYPTRATRRKNLGEFLLWSALSQNDETFLVTLAPKSPGDRPGYDNWVAFAQEHNLPVCFEAAASGPDEYARLFAQARAVMTTSVFETFGQPFLEPWGFGKPLVGRNISGITQDFIEDGMDLSLLYKRLNMPLELLGHDTPSGRSRVRECISEGLKNAWEPFGRTPTEDDVQTALDSICSDEEVDFGRLDEELQEQILTRIMESMPEREHLRPTIPVISGVTDEMIDSNREHVRQQYSLQAYAERVQACYQALLESNDSECPIPSCARLVNQFLKPANFFMLRA